MPCLPITCVVKQVLLLDNVSPSLLPPSSSPSPLSLSYTYPPLPCPSNNAQPTGKKGRPLIGRLFGPTTQWEPPGLILSAPEDFSSNSNGLQFGTVSKVMQAQGLAGPGTRALPMGVSISQANPKDRLIPCGVSNSQ